MKTNRVQIKQFGVKKSNNPTYRFTPPELIPNVMYGNVYGHPEFSDGSGVEASRVKTIKGKKVTTVSGREYICVGEPDERFLNWLKSQGKEYNPEKPFDGLEEYLFGSSEDN